MNILYKSDLVLTQRYYKKDTSLVIELQYIVTEF